MTKKEMVREIAAELKIDQVLTKKIVQKCLDGILHVIQDQGRIELRNFGVFEMKQRAHEKREIQRQTRKCLCPQNGYWLSGPARTSPESCSALPFPKAEPAQTMTNENPRFSLTRPQANSYYWSLR